MHKLKAIAGVIWLAAALVLPRGVEACPSCRDAPGAASSSGEQDGSRNAAAYNHSIYLMAGVPYITLSVFGFFIYRGMKKNEEYRRARGWTGDSRPTSIADSPAEL